MGAGCAPKVGPAPLRLPIQRAQSTQIRSSANSRHTCSIFFLHGHLAVWPCQGQPAPSLPGSSFGLFQTTSMEVRHMGRGLWVEGETTFLPGAESVAGPPVSWWLSAEVQGAGAMLPEAWDVFLPGEVVFEMGLSRNTWAFQQKLSMRMSLVCP